MELAFTLWDAKEEEWAKITLLHGMGGTGALWRPIAATFENHYRILAPDQRAHGESRRADLTSFAPLDYGQDIVDTIDAISFHPTWIIGHSMGVRSAAAAAWLRPSQISGLILVDLGFTGPAGGGLGQNLYDFLKILPAGFTTRNGAREFMRSHCPDPAIAQYLMAVALSHSDGSLEFPFDRDGLLRTLEAAQGSSIRDWLLKLASAGMPILALRGEKSTVWSAEDFQKEKANFAYFSHVEFVEIAAAGHGLPFEKRREFATCVEEFLKKHRLQKS